MLLSLLEFFHICCCCFVVCGKGINSVNTLCMVLSHQSLKELSAHKTCHHPTATTSDYLRFVSSTIIKPLCGFILSTSLFKILIKPFSRFRNKSVSNAFWNPFSKRRNYKWRAISPFAIMFLPQLYSIIQNFHSAIFHISANIVVIDLLQIWCMPERIISLQNCFTTGSSMVTGQSKFH